MLDCLDIDNERSLPSGVITRISLTSNSAVPAIKEHFRVGPRTGDLEIDKMKNIAAMSPASIAGDNRPTSEDAPDYLAESLAACKKQFKLLTTRLPVIEGVTPAKRELQSTVCSVVIKLAIIAVVFCSGLSLVPFLFMLLYFTCFSVAVCLFIVTVVLASAGLCGFILVLFGCLPVAVLATVNELKTVGKK